MPTHHRGDVRERRALNAYINLKRAVNVIDGALLRSISAAGLTETQFAVLEALHHLGGLDQTTLCRKLLTSGGNLTLVLDNLEAKGWVRREVDEKDRRKKVVRLLPAGRKLIGRIFPAHARRVAEAFSVLGSDEQEALRALCRRLGTGRDEGEGRTS